MREGGGAEKQVFTLTLLKVMLKTLSIPIWVTLYSKSRPSYFGTLELMSKIHLNPT